MVIKREEVPLLIDLIGLITSADFNQLEAGDNRFQNLSRFPALILILHQPPGNVIYGTCCHRNIIPHSRD